MPSPHAHAPRPDAQLDALARLRPPALLDELSWDAAVRDALWAASYVKSVSST